MSIPSSRAVAVVLLGVAAAPACRTPEPPAPEPLASREQYCWWSVFRTTLPTDSVAVHFVDAFQALGLHGGEWTQRGDTAWARAEPTALADWHGATYSARVVAYRVGDSTHFRHYVAVAPPRGGWPPPHDSVTDDGRHVFLSPSGSPVGFCGALGRAAQVHGTAPANPDGEERLDIWTRTTPED